MFDQVRVAVDQVAVELLETRERLDALIFEVAGEWDAVHGGYDNTAALQDPNRVVPLDALRALERAGVIGRLLDDLFVTVGNMGSLNAMKRIGAEIAATLVQRGVQAVVLPAT